MVHKQAILIVLSYVIGFTTAYIVFGLDERYDYKARDSHSNDHKSIKSEERVGVAIREEGLYALLEGKERILSAKTDGPAENGWHYEVARTQVSPNQQFIYYCLQMNEVGENCYHYVYEIESDTSYTVSQVDSQHIASGLNELTASWTEDNRLSINGHISASSMYPWKMISK